MLVNTNRNCNFRDSFIDKGCLSEYALLTDDSVLVRIDTSSRKSISLSYKNMNEFLKDFCVKENVE